MIKVGSKVMILIGPPPYPTGVVVRIWDNGNMDPIATIKSEINDTRLNCYFKSLKEIKSTKLKYFRAWK
jgi:hypothetical protein